MVSTNKKKQRNKTKNFSANWITLRMILSLVTKSKQMKLKTRPLKLTIIILLVILGVEWLVKIAWVMFMSRKELLLARLGKRLTMLFRRRKLGP